MDEIDKRLYYAKERERIGKELKIKQAAREAERRAKEEAERAEYRNRIAAQKIAAETARQISEESRANMPQQTQMPSGSNNVFGLVQQWIGTLTIVCCLINAFLLDGLTVSNSAAGGRIFNLSLAHQNLLLFLTGAFLCIYGRLLRMR